MKFFHITLYLNSFLFFYILFFSPSNHDDTIFPVCSKIFFSITLYIIIFLFFSFFYLHSSTSHFIYFYFSIFLFFLFNHDDTIFHVSIKLFYHHILSNLFFNFSYFYLILSKFLFF